MCDQTMPYTVGSFVWCKILNRVWWPGQVVDRSTVPNDFNEYTIKKKNPIAIVYFERDNSYECVINMDKVFLYSCKQKLDFLEKGYSLYLKQSKGGTIIGNLNMSNFLEDVVSIEKQIGGDEQIFDQFKVESVNSSAVSQMIKELFVTSKNQKKKGRKSLPTFKTPTPKEKSSVQKYKPSTSQTPLIPGSYLCYFKTDCPFSTNRYDALKRHVNEHKNEKSIKNDEIIKPKADTKSTVKSNAKTSKSVASTSKATLSSPKKRKNVKNKKPASKKIKLEEEILKDWDDGDEESTNEDEFQNSHGDVADTTSNTNLSINDSRNDNESINEEKSVRSASVSGSELADHESDNETNTDDNLVKLMKSNEKQSNEYVDEIDDQNSTISFTENTSDQMSVDKAESEISCDINKSDTSILTTDNKVIDNDNDNDKSIDATSSKNYINDKTDDMKTIDVSVNHNVETERDSIALNVETCGDKDSIDQELEETSENKVDSSKDSPFECLLDRIPKPEWMITENWEMRVPIAVEEARRTMTYDPSISYMKLPQKRRMPQMYDFSLEAQPDIEVHPLPSPSLRRQMWVEVKDTPEKVYTDDELKTIPSIKNLIKRVRSGQSHDAFISIDGAKFIPEKTESKTETE